MFHDLDDRVNVVNKEGFISPVERSSSRVIVFSKHKRTKGGTVLVEHDSRVKELTTCPEGGRELRIS